MTAPQVHGWRLPVGLWAVVALSIGLPIAAAFVLAVSSRPRGSCCPPTSGATAVETSEPPDAAKDKVGRSEDAADVHASHGR